MSSTVARVSLSSNFDRQVVERMLEYVERTSPWTRQLWSVSATTELRELLECSEAVVSQTLSTASLRYVRSALPARIMRDPGFGSKPHRAALKDLLPKEDLVAHGHDWHAIAKATTDARDAYLPNWSAALNSGETVSLERTAASIAAFLLDEGLSGTWIHRWLTYHLRHNPTSVSLADLVGEASAKLTSGRQTLHVLITFAEPPKIPSPPPPGWLTGSQVRPWRRSHGCGDVGQRQYGGLVLAVQAFEPYGAVLAAADRLARVRARFVLGSKRSFVPNELVWVEGHQEPFDLVRESRRVEVHSLERSDQLFELQLADPAIDAALELLEPALEGQMTSAMAGAWAAIESLLTGPGDRGNVAAADRLARIAACSFVRHELTTLAWEHSGVAGDSLAVQITACSDNRSRARLMEQHIIGGGTPAWRHSPDELAFMRVKKVLPPDAQGLSDIEAYLQAAMRRLYRQRNLLLHAGKMDAVALHPTLRTTTPIVAAGLDRIVAASVERGVTALEFAASTKLAMDRYRSGSLSSVVDLLT